MYYLNCIDSEIEELVTEETSYGDVRITLTKSGLSFVIGKHHLKECCFETIEECENKRKKLIQQRINYHQKEIKILEEKLRV